MCLFYWEGEGFGQCSILICFKSYFNDFFQGQFVCIYAGDVLSDDKANALGQTQGDEYFADLDLIQVAEREKEGYEEEIEEEIS